ncbi:MAG: peptide-methionine (S)-S-oxide reductase [Alphaproteobacteria bacterium RIFCSPHIGHO2_12_FULL_63_12]|nr:MAG: peptide-methionine (S)-S-oxide reductase [Alphaproteobacteria bacterium RIFCSPHIGHO2_12_FULL_63_12]
MTRFSVPLLALAAFAAALFFTQPSSASEPAPEAASNGLATAIFAGGCFWCVESDFEKLDGVRGAVSGYSGGLMQNPTYEDHEGHLEAVEVTYDPSVVSYRSLVDYHLRHIDPLDDGGQFCDRGPAYKSAIFAADAGEWADAQASIKDAEKVLGRKIVTPVLDRGEFWIAEGYHQDYHLKNKLKYKFYRTTCGRDARVKKVWGAAH